MVMVIPILLAGEAVNIELELREINRYFKKLNINLSNLLLKFPLDSS